MPEQWIIWNQYHGTTQRAVISDLRPWKRGATGKLDGLKHDDIGRIPVDDLINKGCVERFGYYVMSPDYWQKNERRLRQEFARHVFAEGRRSSISPEKLLGLSPEEKPTKESLDDAYHLFVKTAHPDKGGDESLFAAITTARHELLKKIEIGVIDDDDDIPF